MFYVFNDYKINDHYGDFRTQDGENFPTSEIALFFRSQKGFRESNGFSISSAFLKWSKVKNVEKILTQTYQQLEWEMPDPDLGISIKPDHILLIVSGDITEAAKKYIYGYTLVKRKRVLLWEKDRIIQLCRERGLPEEIQKIILEFNKKKTNK